jgi:hypothetical protein
MNGIVFTSSSTKWKESSCCQTLPCKKKRFLLSKVTMYHALQTEEARIDRERQPRWNNMQRSNFKEPSKSIYAALSLKAASLKHAGIN